MIDLEDRARASSIPAHTPHHRQRNGPHQHIHFLHFIEGCPCTHVPFWDFVHTIFKRGRVSTGTIRRLDKSRVMTFPKLSRSAIDVAANVAMKLGINLGHKSASITGSGTHLVDITPGLAKIFLTRSRGEQRMCATPGRKHRKRFKTNIMRIWTCPQTGIWIVAKFHTNHLC